MKRIIINTTFWIILIYSLLLIFAKFLFNPFDFLHTNMPPQINVINAGIEYSKKQDYVPNFCLNQYCIPTSSFSSGKSFSLGFLKKTFEPNPKAPKFVYINKYSIAIPYKEKDNFEKNIRDIIFSVGENKFYFNKDEILKFEKERKITEIILDTSGNTGSFDCMVYHLPKSLPSNFNGIKNTLLSWFLSLFSGNCKKFAPSLIGFIICAVIYSYNRELFDFKFKITHRTVVFFITGLSIILRYITCLDTRIFIDEIYTKNIATLSFISCFQDPGNPPLFYLLEYLMSKIFGNQFFVYRILPFIFSLAFVFLVYIFFKKINKSFALLMMFLAGVNIYSVSYSSVLRSVTFCMALVVASSYFLIEYLKTKDNKNFITYCILAFASINTHYFLLFYIGGNFFWGIFKLINNKKELKKFIIANFMCALTFIPYLCTVFKTAMSEDFNSNNISELNSDNITRILSDLFHYKIIFYIFVLITLLFIVLSFLSKEILKKYKIKINENSKNIFLYLSYSIVFVIITGALISIFIKPVMDSRILYCSIYGLMFLLFGIILYTIFDFNLNNKKTFCFKVVYTIFLTILLSGSINMPEQKAITNINSYMFYLEKDIKNYINNGYEVIAFITYDKKIVNHYSALKNLKEINWVVTNTNNGTTSTKITNKVLNKAIKDNNSGKKIVIYSTDISIGNLMTFDYLSDKAAVFNKGKIIKIVLN